MVSQSSAPGRPALLAAADATEPGTRGSWRDALARARPVLAASWTLGAFAQGRRAARAASRAGCPGAPGVASLRDRLLGCWGLGPPASRPACAGAAPGGGPSEPTLALARHRARPAAACGSGRSGPPAAALRGALHAGGPLARGLAARRARLAADCGWTASRGASESNAERVCVCVCGSVGAEVGVYGDMGGRHGRFASMGQASVFG